jgi:transcriptional regulator NrdR family protein
VRALSSRRSRRVSAAAALDEELHAYDELAREARRIKFDSEKSVSRGLRIVQESQERNDAVQEKLRALVTQMEQARERQVESLTTLLETARTVQARAQEHEALMARFAALAESAQRVNALALELSAKRSAGASEAELLQGLGEIQMHMATVVGEAEALAQRATEQEWPELARQADAVRQQVLAAKNRLALAHKAVATRAPS